MDKIIDMTDEITNNDAEVDEINELSNQYISMVEKKTEKMNLGRKSLVEMLMVTRDKFRTVNGTNHIYQAMLDAKLYKNYKCSELLADANEIAESFADCFNKIVSEIDCRVHTIEDIQTIVMHHLYTSNFTYVEETDFIEELISIQMVREIDGTCNDLLEFERVADEEINKVYDMLYELNGEAAVKAGMTAIEHKVDMLKEANKELKEFINKDTYAE